MKDGMKKTAMLCLLALAVALMAAKPAAAVDCELKFTLKGWAAFYKTASGSGVITCDNGETRKVDLKIKGGGLSFGKSDVVNGTGRFTVDTSTFSNNSGKSRHIIEMR